MPSGKKNIYGERSKALYKAGDMAGEIGAQRNAAAAARLAGRKPDAAKITAREGQTNASGARAPVKMPAKTPAPKQQVIRTTKPFKPSPMTTKRK
jgi:hypothetical protein